jgi:hypothetical protein
MSQSIALTTPEKQRALEPMEMVQIAFQAAVDSGKGLEVIDRILAQQREMMEYRDREAFNAALRRIQDKLKPIAKTGWNPQTSSHYATLDAIDDMIDPLIQGEGMTLSFEPESCDQPQMVRIVGILSLGAYSKRYPLDMPTDGQGPKGGGVMTRTHATGSAVAYGIRYIKRMIFNLRLKDDDGNKAGGKQAGSLDERKQIEMRDNILNAANRGELQRLYLLALSAAEAIGDATAIRAFIAAKTQRMKEIA